jgi:DMSO/TMAO reductase YedYZ molybdopterin-dependent catalytic subunit
MANVVLSRRAFLTASAAGASSLVLAGCDQFDFVGNRGDQTRTILDRANSLTYAVQRLLGGGSSLARTYDEAEIRQLQRPNGSTNPQSAEYLAMVANNFADYRLRVVGLVDRELSFSLDELRNMAAQSQVTRHDCVEGWSCIAKWTGTRLGPILDMAGLKPQAHFLVYHCFDSMDGGLSGPEAYYESSDLIDAYHPQTILAYGLNGQTLPVSNGAPVRLRIERALGYKQPKYLHTVEVIDSYDSLRHYGKGYGGYWEDHGYDWYGGI